MPTVSEIVEFLHLTGQSGRDQLAAIKFDPDISVDRITLDTEAEPGSLAWISEKNCARFPERLEGYRGALLICPQPVPAAVTTSGGLLVPCRSPKLAFIRVVSRFFSHLLTLDFPDLTSQPIHPEAAIGDNVRIAFGAVIGANVKIGNNVVVGPNTCLVNCIIHDGVVIGANCSIGLPGFGYEKDEAGRYWRFPHLGRVIIETGVEIGSNTCIDRGALGDTIIRAGTKVDNLVHIAHNVSAGPDAMLIANAMLGGSARIGANAWVAPSVSVMNQAEVGENAVLGMGAVVLKDVEPGRVMVGNPARPLQKKR